MVNELAALCELMLVEEFEDYASVYCFIQVNRDSTLQQAATVADECLNSQYNCELNLSKYTLVS